MYINFSKRSYEPEIMDDLEMEGEELASTLRQIANVNRWLGGTKVILSGLKKILKNRNKENPVLKIVDIGCGGGEILRAVAEWGRRKNIKMELVGIDANLYTVNFAASESKKYPEISFRQCNVFEMETCAGNYDIALCSLFLHHFNEDEIAEILIQIYKKAALGVIVNDLQRSFMAYYLFKLITFVLGASEMVKYDGLLSIRKSFNKKELKNLAELSAAKNYKISWKWAFRFEMLLLKP